MIIPITTKQLYVYNVENWEEKKSKLTNMVGDNKLDEVSPNGLCTFYSDRGKSTYRDLFVNIFTDELTKFAQEVNMPKLNIMDVWKVKYEKGNYHTVHTHGTTSFSGILYFDISDDFPNNSTQFVTDWSNPLTNGTDVISPNVKEGTILIFPSQIPHFTLPHKEDKPRVVYSFDINVGDKLQYED